MGLFQQVTIGCNLMLHPEASLRLDADTLKAEYAAADAVLSPEERTR